MYLLSNRAIPFIDWKATLLLPKTELHFCTGSYRFSPPLASLQTALHPLPQVSHILSSGIEEDFKAWFQTFFSRWCQPSTWIVGSKGPLTSPFFWLYYQHISQCLALSSHLINNLLAESPYPLRFSVGVKKANLAAAWEKFWRGESLC